MTTNGDTQERGKERDERDARFFAWDVPGDANIVALVHESEDAERSATVVDAIATSIARRREHTLLLSTEPGPSPLDELLGGGDSEGLPAALTGQARLTDVAVQRVDRPFVYLPAGRDSAAMRALLEADVLVSFVERVRERGGTLFMVVSEGALLSQGLRDLLDGYVALGDAKVPRDAEGLLAFGRVRFDDPDEIVTDAEQHGDTEPGEVPRWDDPRLERTLAELTIDEALTRAEVVDPDVEEAATPESNAAASFAFEPEPAASQTEEGDEVGEIALVGAAGNRGFTANLTAIGAGVVAVLLAGWWWFASSSGAPTVGGELTNVALAEAAVEDPTPPLDPAEAARVFASAPELPFSVLIASYAAKVDADADLARLRAARGLDDAGVFFIAPTPVRGVLYHRLFAGALSAEAEAVRLMERLVAGGQKDQASAWDVRPARSAFDLGVFLDRAAAEARVSGLEAKGVPSYVLAAPMDDHDVYQVYAGAYENERASLPMAEILGAAGEPASLIVRQGGATPPPSTP